MALNPVSNIFSALLFQIWPRNKMLFITSFSIFWYSRKCNLIKSLLKKVIYTPRCFLDFIQRVSWYIKTWKCLYLKRTALRFCPYRLISDVYIYWNSVIYQIFNFVDFIFFVNFLHDMIIYTILVMFFNIC